MLCCTRHLSAVRAVWSALSTQCTVNLEHSNALSTQCGHCVWSHVPVSPARQPYISAKEPYISAKESDIESDGSAAAEEVEEDGEED